MSQPLDAAVIELVRAEFDAEFYLAANDDVRGVGADPFEHFLIFGAREGRDPSPGFSIRRYIDMNPDVRASGMNGFVHWVTLGRAEGRATDHGMGFRFETLWNATPLERRILDLRLAQPDRAPDDSVALTAAVGDLGDRAAHVTIGHDDFSRGVGGVQLCIRLEGEAMRAAGRAHVHIFPSAAGVVVDVERDAPTLGVLIDGRPIGHFTPEAVADVLGPAIAARPATFALHSLIGHPVPRTLALLKAMGMTEGFYWLHDYASLCAGYALMRDDVIFCGAPPMDSPACEVCAYGVRRRVQLPAHVELFQAFALTVVAPSRAALDLWKVRFPVSPAAMTIHPHARLIERAETLPAPKRKRPLRVGFLGMPLAHKGWGVFVDLVSRFGDDPRYEFHHLAKRRDPRVPAAFMEVTPTDAEPQPMIPAIEAAELDVVVLWSLWPETFCFAAYEAVAAGAALVACADAGNVADFIRDRPESGIVLPDETALTALFESDALQSLSRLTRQLQSYDLAMSRMTADLILEVAP